MSTVYISPTGSGDKSGSSWANAATITSLDAMIKKAGPGGQVLLQADAGTYKVTSAISITGSGTDDSPVTIKGVATNGADMPVHIEGTRPFPYVIGNPAGNELFKLNTGADNLKFENFSIHNTGTPFRVAGDLKNLTIEDVDAHNVQKFFENNTYNSLTTATISGLTIRDVNVEGFSKGVVRLKYDTNNVLIENVVGDSQRQDGDNFAMGVHLDGTVHDVVLRKVTMMNAQDTRGDADYWNGDGFVAEYGVRNVLFEDTVSKGNTDGGYDLKSSATTLVRAIAEDNKRNFRIHGEVTLIDVVGLNPDRRGGSGSQAQVWVGAKGHVQIKGGEFKDAGSNTIVFHNEGTNPVTFLGGTEVVYAATAKLILGWGLTSVATMVDASTVLAVGTTSAGTFFETALTTSTGSTTTGTTGTTTGTTTDSTTGTSTGTTTDSTTGTTSGTTTSSTTGTSAGTTTESTSSSSTTSTTTQTVAQPVQTKFTSTTANETFTGTQAAETFYFKLSINNGTDTIKNFGKDDVLVFSSMLKDSNRDGLITFSSSGLDLGNGGKLILPGVEKGLRLLGQDQDGYVYGDASVRPKNAQESKIMVGDKLAGDRGDKALNKFFFDTAIDRQLGSDQITNFGKKDILVTTDKLGDGPAGSKIYAQGGSFALEHDDHSVGTVAITNTGGSAVTALEFDGEVTAANGVHYYVYSLVGSDAGLAHLTA